VIKRGKRLNFLIRTWQTRRLVRKIKPDILHAHYIFGYGLFGALSGFHPFVVSPWGSDIATFPEKSKIHRSLVKYALKRADLVHVGDETTAERVKSLIGGRSSIHLIKWGIKPDLFRPNRNKKDDIIRSLYLRKSQEPYGPETLLYAIPKVIKEHENVEFLMLKSGKEINKTYSIVKKLGIEKYVKFIDEIPYDRVPKLMNSCDIFVEAVYRETVVGIGITDFEAMSCELPVLLPNTPGIEQFIKNEVNGLVYKGEDSDSLSKVIIRLVEDEGLRKKLGKNARQYVLKKQDWNKNMKLMENFYEKLTKGGIKV
jgi:glycosyltransferase involved in cell wall biosynthesis